VQHWKDGGHDQLCKLIKRGGGAEQYNADQRYTKAVTVAAEACAEDTKGQTCYICTEAVHRHTKEGLVRGCSCRGTAGFAHVSCLAEQTKLLVAEAMENNLFDKANKRFQRWDTCGLCEQKYHGVVHCALGWACWKTYVGRPEGDPARRMAISVLGNGLEAAKHHEDALSVQEAELAMHQRLGASAECILIVQGNLARTHIELGRLEEALLMRRVVYSGFLKLNGEEHSQTLIAANNYASSLLDLNRCYAEAKSLMRKTMPVARRVLGEDHDTTLAMRQNFAMALYKDTDATLDDLREAVTTIEDTERIARRVLGGAHPIVQMSERNLENARAALREAEQAL